MIHSPEAVWSPEDMLGTRGSRREERSDVLEGSQTCFLDIFDCLAVQVLETETDRTVIDRLLVQLPPICEVSGASFVAALFFFYAATKVHGDLRLLRKGPPMAVFVGTGCRFMKKKVGRLSSGEALCLRC